MSELALRFDGLACEFLIEPTILPACDTPRADDGSNKKTRSTVAIMPLPTPRDMFDKNLHKFSNGEFSLYWTEEEIGRVSLIVCRHVPGLTPAAWQGANLGERLAYMSAALEAIRSRGSASPRLALPAQAEPSAQKDYLTSWRSIVLALGLKNTTEEKRKVRKLAERSAGPIVLAAKRGGQPTVERGALVTWWNELDSQFGAMADRTSNRQATVQGQYVYSRDGILVPEISGQVHRPRSDKGTTR